MIRGTKLSRKRYGREARVRQGRRRARRAARSCSSRARTAPGRRRCCACSPASTPRRAASSSCRDRGVIGYLGHEPLVYRELTAAREPPPVRPPLPAPGAGRAGRDAARALRPLGRPRPSGSSTFSRGMRQRLGALPGAAPRPGARDPRRAVQRARRRRRRRSSTRRSTSCTARAPSSSRRTTPARVERLATQQARVRMSDREVLRRRRRARAQGPADRAAGQGDACRRCSCSSSRR